jgi:hypothetical protein
MSHQQWPRVAVSMATTSSERIVSPTESTRTVYSITSQSTLRSLRQLMAISYSIGTWELSSQKRNGSSSHLSSCLRVILRRGSIKAKVVPTPSKGLKAGKRSTWVETNWIPKQARPSWRKAHWSNLREWIEDLIAAVLDINTRVLLPILELIFTKSLSQSRKEQQKL